MLKSAHKILLPYKIRSRKMNENGDLLPVATTYITYSLIALANYITYSNFDILFR